MSSAIRTSWIDHLRTIAIALVVNMHACVTASHVGDWYVTVDPEPPMTVKAWFILWQAHLQAFFMGLLFFLAGQFAGRSIARRGPASFLRERLLRLVVPTILYMLVIHPFIILGLNPNGNVYASRLAWYERYLVSGRVFSGSGPMWFALALFVFCAALAVWRALRPAPVTSPTPPDPAAPPFRMPGWAPLALGLALAVATFAVRLWQPLGSAVINLQLCYFAQYIAAFALGVWVARRNALDAIAASRTAKVAGLIALVAGPAALVALMMAGGPPPEEGAGPYAGGMHWQALGLALWEQMTGVALALGLMALCHRRLNVETPFLRWLADRSFGVYLLHPPVLIALTMLLRGRVTNPFALALALTLTALVGSYVVADLARRTPGLRRVV